MKERNQAVCLFCYPCAGCCRFPSTNCLQERVSCMPICVFFQKSSMELSISTSIERVWRDVCCLNSSTMRWICYIWKSVFDSTFLLLSFPMREPGLVKYICWFGDVGQICEVGVLKLLKSQRSPWANIFSNLTYVPFQHLVVSKFFNVYLPSTTPSSKVNFLVNRITWNLMWRSRRSDLGIHDVNAWMRV